jgi:hypothetical protein
MKDFSSMMKNRFLDPSEIGALDFKGQIRRSAVWLVSATIGSDRPIFDNRSDGAPSAHWPKIPSPEHPQTRQSKR